LASLVALSWADGRAAVRITLNTWAPRGERKWLAAVRPILRDIAAAHKDLKRLGEEDVRHVAEPHLLDIVRAVKDPVKAVGIENGAVPGHQGQVKVVYQAPGRPLGSSRRVNPRQGHFQRAAAWGTCNGCARQRPEAVLNRFLVLHRPGFMVDQHKVRRRGGGAIVDVAENVEF
jgi:hypothetical protein